MQALWNSRPMGVVGAELMMSLHHALVEHGCSNCHQQPFCHQTGGSSAGVRGS